MDQPGFHCVIHSASARLNSMFCTSRLTPSFRGVPRCLHAHNVKKNARLSLTRCYDNEFPDERLRWTMNEDTQLCDAFRAYDSSAGAMTARIRL